jgi:hypothetical protein
MVRASPDRLRSQDRLQAFEPLFHLVSLLGLEQDAGQVTNGVRDAGINFAAAPG